MKNKRIAFLVSQFPVLSETFILNQITGFIKEGWIVKIFTKKTMPCGLLHDDIKKYKLMQDTQTFVLSSKNKNVIRCLAVLHLFYTFFFTPKQTLKLFKNIVKGYKTFSYEVFFLSLKILRSKTDIVFCQFGSNGVTAALVKRLLPSLKFAVMFHGYDIRLPKTEAQELYKQLFLCANIVLANSSYTYQHLLDFGAPQKKTKIQYYGIDVDKMPKKISSSTKNRTEIIILSVCRLVEEKGLSYGITAFAEVAHNSSQKVLYYIVGDGPLKESLKRKALLLGIENNVVFWGSKTQEEVVDFYNQADIFFLPSIKEAFGLVLLEAQAMHLPIVATNAGGISEAVLKNQSAFIVPACNCAKMSEKLLYLINNSDVRFRMGQMGRKFVEQKFDLTTITKQLTQRIESIR